MFLSLDPKPNPLPSSSPKLQSKVPSLLTLPLPLTPDLP